MLGMLPAARCRARSRRGCFVGHRQSALGGNGVHEPIEAHRHVARADIGSASTRTGPWMRRGAPAEQSMLLVLAR